jgi:hypothetical protein
VVQHDKFGDPNGSNVVCHLGIRFKQTWVWTILHWPIKLENPICWFSKFSDPNNTTCQIYGPLVQYVSYCVSSAEIYCIFLVFLLFSLLPVFCYVSGILEYI